jgi:hypothetical protein
MKNQWIELKKQRARLYHRQHSSHFENGVIVRHDYSGLQANALTYWDDTAFIVNDYRVALWRSHPRFRLESLISDEALRRVEHCRPDVELFANAMPNYVKVGRSRKKISSWTTQPDPALLRYYDLLHQTERQVGMEVTFEVRTELKVNWYDWGKGMSLCAPFEVRNKQDLKALVDIARRLVRHESTLQVEFGDYVYTSADWLRERAALEAHGQSAVFSHAVAHTK